MLLDKRLFGIYQNPIEAELGGGGGLVRKFDQFFH